MNYRCHRIKCTLIRYNVMQQKGVGMENMEFYFAPRNEPKECTAVTLQEVENKNGGRVKTNSSYLINGKKNSLDLLVQLSIARGTFYNVFESRGHAIGFAEVGNNPVVLRAMETTLDKLPKLIERINSKDIDYEER